jgi:hypothetical protein
LRSNPRADQTASAGPTRARVWTAVAITLVIWSLTTHGKYSVSGDEPHYLMVCESLTEDGDLDLENNYRANAGRRFGHDNLAAGAHVRPTRGGALWSVHDIGLPLILAPVYASATRLAGTVPPDRLARFRMTPGLFAYSLISLLLIAITAFACSLLLDGLLQITDRRTAILATLAVALSPPVLAHAFLVFPETIAFAIVCWAVRVALRTAEGTSVRELTGLALALGLMPWLHRKYAPLVLGLAGMLIAVRWAWLRRQRASTLLTLAVLFLVPHVALHVWTYASWGRIGGPQLLDSLPFSLSALSGGFVGLLLDREYGLAAYAPIYLLALPALLLAFMRSWWLLVPSVLLYVPMAAFNEWWGGFAPAARYLVPVVPLITAAAVRSFDTRVMRVAATAALAVQLAILVVVWQRPRLLWPQRTGSNPMLPHIPVVGGLYEWLLPVVAAGPDWGQIVSRVLIIGGGVTMLAIAANRERALRRRPRAAAERDRAVSR